MSRAGGGAIDVGVAFDIGEAEHWLDRYTFASILWDSPGSGLPPTSSVALLSTYSPPLPGNGKLLVPPEICTFLSVSTFDVAKVQEVLAAASA